MALPATDDFAGSGALIASWTVISGQGTPLRASGVVNVTTTGLDAGAFWNADAFNGDHSAQIKAAAAAGTDKYIALALRVQAGGNFYMAGVFGVLGGSVTSRIRKVISGSATTIGADGSATVNVGDTLYADVVGTTITLYLNGGSILSRTDAAISGGSPGFFLFADSPSAVDAAIDDFVGDNVAAAAARVPYQPNYQMAPVMAQ